MEATLRLQNCKSCDKPILAGGYCYHCGEDAGTKWQVGSGLTFAQAYLAISGHLQALYLSKQWQTPEQIGLALGLPPDFVERTLKSRWRHAFAHYRTRKGCRQWQA